MHTLEPLCNLDQSLHTAESECLTEILKHLKNKKDAKTNNH